MNDRIGETLENRLKKQFVAEGNFSYDHFSQGTIPLLKKDLDREFLTTKSRKTFKR